MLKKGLSVLLVLLLVVGTIAVLPVSAAAKKADDVPSSEEQGAQFVEPNEDIEAELDAADAEWEREHSELAGTGAEADLAYTGAETFRYNSSGRLVDGNDYYVIEIGQHHTERVKAAYNSVDQLNWSSSDSSVAKVVETGKYEITSGHYGTFSIEGRSVGKCRITCFVRSYGPSIIGNWEWDTRSSDFYYRVVEKGKAVPGTYIPGSSSSSTNLSSPQITGCESLDSGVKINWKAVSGAARYRVYYYGKGWTKMDSVTTNSYIDTDVKSGGKYTYTVRCVNSSDTAFTSDRGNSYVYTYNMATPKITDLSSTSAGVKITWGKVPNASRYRVYYKNRSGGWTNMKETTGTTYTDDDVIYGGNYTYTVRCVNSSGRFTSGFNSDGWNFTHYLSTPKITGCESLSNGVNIKWNAISGAQKYRVYYKNGRGGWTKMGETSGTSFVDDDVRSGYPYTYTVRCINNSLDRFMSDCDTNGYRYTYNPSFSTPHITSCETVSNGIKISWGAVPGVKRYALYYLSANDGWRRMKETTSTSFIDTDVRYGNPYTYTVRCLTDNGKDFASGYDSAGFKTRYYSTPKITSVTLNGNRLNVNISDTHQAATYKIWIKNNLTQEYEYLGSVTSKSDYIILKSKMEFNYMTHSYEYVYSLKEGGYYRFYVQGYDSSDKSCTGFDENGFAFYV